MLRQSSLNPSNSLPPSPRRSVSPKRLPSDIRVRRLNAISPKFYAVPHDRVAQEGETVRFQCSIAGHPEPWATWTKDGQNVISNRRIAIKENDDLRILEISQVTPEDAGVYRVTVENNFGKVEANAKLDVIKHRDFSMRGLRARSASPRPSSYNRSGSNLPPYGNRQRLDLDIHPSIPSPYIRWNNYQGPKFVKEFPLFVEAKDGSPLALEAQVEGSGPFDIVWMKDGCVIPDCEDFKQTVCEDGRILLKIRDVFAQDAGNYRCEVYNPLGEAVSKFRITVNGRRLRNPLINHF